MYEDCQELLAKFNSDCRSFFGAGDYLTLKFL